MFEVLTAIRNSLRRHWPLYLGGLLVALLAWSALDAHGGTPEPTAGEHLSRGAVVVNSSLLVLREGLEAILVLAAVRAACAARRRTTGGRRGRRAPRLPRQRRDLVRRGRLPWQPAAPGSPCRPRPDCSPWPSSWW